VSRVRKHCLPPVSFSFLSNNPQLLVDTEKFGILSKTTSVWAYVTAHKADFDNILYDPNAHKISPRLAPHPSQVTLWTGTLGPSSLHNLMNHFMDALDHISEYYLRWATAASNDRTNREIAIQLASTISFSRVPLQREYGN
jgi:hypothetical protein